MKKFCCAFLAALFLAGCKDHHVPISRDANAMGTFLSITIYDQGLAEESANALIDAAIAEIVRVESMATDYSDNSEVGRVNVSPGDVPVGISHELAALLKRANTFSDRSGGAFDVSVGPLVRLWDFMAANPRCPSDASIDSLLRFVDYRRIGVTDSTVLITRGMRLDLGAIAKGYAVDEAIGVLRRGGVKRSIVDLGGNLSVLWEGTRLFDTTAAVIYVRDPRHDGEYFGSFRIGEAGISTSGDYQRCFFEKGIRYHHILDPHTGYPVRGVVSVTVVTENATDADALSTLAFVLGKERGLEFIERLPDAEAVFVFEEGDTLNSIRTSGFSRFERLH